MLNSLKQEVWKSSALEKKRGGGEDEVTISSILSLPEKLATQNTDDLQQC